MLVVGAVAAALAGVTWYRALTFHAPTGARSVTWYDAAGHPIAPQAGELLGDGLMQTAIVIGNRLIVDTDGPAQGKAGPGGFAWIEPELGQARIAWPVPTTYALEVCGVAVRDATTFALALISAHDTPEGVRSTLLIGIAGRDGWDRPPAAVAEWDARANRGRPLLFGLSWVGGELQAVITHPRGADEYGQSSPVDVITLPTRGRLRVRSMPFDCECVVVGALPGKDAWSLILEGGHAMIRRPSGTIQPAPQLDRVDLDESDRVALGTFWGASGWGANRIARDGTVSQPAPPFPGWGALPVDRRVVWTAAGGLQRQLLWSPHRGDDLSLVAQRVAGRTIVTGSRHDELEWIGDTPGALRPAIDDVALGDFEIGTMLPRAGGGYFWVDGDGHYVTLDAQLRRTDSLSVREHLRRHSTSDVDYEARLGWALLSLPLFAVLGLLVGLAARRRNADGTRGPVVLAPVTASLVLYVIIGGWALRAILPLL